MHGFDDIDAAENPAGPGLVDFNRFRFQVNDPCGRDGEPQVEIDLDTDVAPSLSQGSHFNGDIVWPGDPFVVSRRVGTVERDIRERRAGAVGRPGGNDGTGFDTRVTDFREPGSELRGDTTVAPSW